MAIEVRENRPRLDRRGLAVLKAANLTKGDFVRFRNPDNCEREHFENSSYVLKDKEGNEIKVDGQTAFGRPKEVNDAIRERNLSRAKGAVKSFDKEAASQGVQEAEKLRRGRKKYFTP